jgi:hypothetical protein
VKESEIATTCSEWLEMGRRAKSDLFERAELARDFKIGRQWTAAEIEGYKKKGITPITINHCLNIINTVSGMERGNRQEIRALTRMGGIQTVANVNSELIKHAMDQSHGNQVCSESFVQSIVCGEDFVRATVDNSKTPGGRIRVARRSCFEVITDPNALEHDLNQSSRFLIDREWVDKEYIHAMYPDSEEKLNGGSTGGMQGIDPVENVMQFMYGDDYAGDDIPYDPMMDDMERVKYRYLKRWFWWKEFKPALVWVDLQNSKEMILTKVRDIQRAKAATKAMPDRFKAMLP